MARLDKIYARLEKIRDPSVDQALAAALHTADEASVRRIAAVLMERGQTEAMVALVEHYDRLPSDIQRSAAAQVKQLYATLRKAASRDSGACAANTIRMIQQAKEGRLAYLVAEQLRNRPSDIQAQAAQCLLDLARHATTPTTSINQPGVRGRYPCDATAMRYILIAVEEAIGLYGYHRQPAVLLALIVLAPRPIPNALKHLEDQGRKAVPVLSKIFTDAREQVVAAAALPMIRSPILAGAVLEGLVELSKRAGLGPVLTHWHLLLDPAIASPLRATSEAPRLWPRDRAWVHWSDQQVRGLATWAGCVGIDLTDRVAKLDALRQIKDPMARLSVLRTLIGIASRHDRFAAHEVIAQFCRDSDTRLARIALRHLTRVNWSGLSGLLPVLINGDDPQISRLAGRCLGDRGFRQLWDHWPRIPPLNQVAMGRALIKIDPRFMDHLSRKLSHPDRWSQLRAIAIIRRLNQTSFFTSQLVRITQHGDEIAASAAVKALSGVRSDAVRNAITAALKHRDSRVRANAVEALNDLVPTTRDQLELVAMAVHDDARPRANTIGLLFEHQCDHAAALLKKMLADARPASRISGLWLVRALGLTELAGTVAEMSLSDQDPPVRERAQGVLDRLIALMRIDPESLHDPAADRAAARDYEHAASTACLAMSHYEGAFHAATSP